jgi:hypothetical protein
LNIRWQGGAIEKVELRLSSNRAEELRYPDAFVAHIRALAATLDDAKIVAMLDRDGFTSSTGKRFTVSRMSAQISASSISVSVLGFVPLLSTRVGSAYRLSASRPILLPLL